ncbi:hypothetical protein HPB49_021284 [Dermacentor silvarum]|uniref:Uncharacterized protein n=1 Tax=Dermacentor silvarum TaxID=543639 RepID=A0ACB8E313_DERSI|nr:hypothetical protein HPB49_021284 [Dermacentor silvarum]
MARLAATQFAMRLSQYFDRWTELSETAQEYGALRELLIKEQFLISCHLSLSLYLKGRKAKSLQDMLELADQFLEAQGGTNPSKIKKEEPEDAKKPASDERKNPQKPVPRITCTYCGVPCVTLLNCVRFRRLV